MSGSTRAAPVGSLYSARSRLAFRCASSSSPSGRTGQDSWVNRSSLRGRSGAGRVNCAVTRPTEVLAERTVMEGTRQRRPSGSPALGNTSTTSRTSSGEGKPRSSPITRSTPGLAITFLAVSPLSVATRRTTRSGDPCSCSSRAVRVTWMANSGSSILHWSRMATGTPSNWSGPTMPISATVRSPLRSRRNRGK